MAIEKNQVTIEEFGGKALDLLVLGNCERASEEELVNAFKEFDRYNTGYVSSRMLRTVLTEIGMEIL